MSPLVWLSPPFWTTYLDTWDSVTENIDHAKALLITAMQSVRQMTAHSSSASNSAPAPETISSLSGVAASSPPPASSGIWEEFDSKVLASQQHQTTGTNTLIEMCRYTLRKGQLLGIRVQYFAGKTMKKHPPLWANLPKFPGRGCIISGCWEALFKTRTVSESQLKWNKSEKC